MPLPDVVLPGLMTMLESLKPTPPSNVGVGQIAGWSLGPTDSMPQCPYIWVLVDNFESPDQEGSEQEKTDWVVDLICFVPAAMDRQNAEEVLAALIDPIRDYCRKHLKFGFPEQIARARVIHGSWGYMEVNNVAFRTVTLTLSVKEKVAQTFSA